MGPGWSTSPAAPPAAAFRRWMKGLDVVGVVQAARVEEGPERITDHDVDLPAGSDVGLDLLSLGHGLLLVTR
jgi:hypothetical protein